LAAALGVSTMPVREAMSRLVADGALEAHAKRAFVVPQITGSQYRELYLMRLRLEPLATENAAARMSMSACAGILSVHGKMEESRKVHDLLGYLAWHRRFHF